MDATPIDTVTELYRQTRRAAAVGLIATLALGIAKLIGGWYGQSLALLADSVHSLGDALAAGSVWLALKWAERPPDREHPYGHTRIESIAAAQVALALVVSGLWVAWEAFGRWKSPEAGHAPWYTLAIALASVVTNEIIFRYTADIARKTGSNALEASAWDQRLDAFGSLIVLISLLLHSWLGPQTGMIDAIATFIVAAIILYAGGSLYWESLQDLMDRQAGKKVLDEIRRIALSIEGAKGVEKIVARKAGLEYLVELHLEVDPSLSVHAAHLIGHAVKDKLIADIVNVKDVLVHIEPAREADSAIVAGAAARPLATVGHRP